MAQYVTKQDLKVELYQWEDRVEKSLCDRVASVVSESLKKEIAEAVEKKVRVWRWMGVGFVGGFGLLVTVGIATWSDLRQSITKRLYPPEVVARDLTPHLKPILWDTISSGTKNQYEKLVKRLEFSDALRSHHGSVMRELTEPSSSKTERGKQAMIFGRAPRDAQILMPQNGFDGKQTSQCKRTFKHKQLQVIVVLPKDAKDDFGWLNCAYGWPDLFLTIKVAQKTAATVELVDVRRSDDSNILQLLVSQEVAKKLELAGWRTFKFNGFGTFSISEVR